MYLYDEESTIIEDDMTVDQKVYKLWISGQDGLSSGMGIMPATLNSLPFLPRTDRVPIVTKEKPRMRKGTKV